MDGWGEFALVAGGAASALIGLLFVAVSIRAEVFGRSLNLRSRAAQTLGLFLTVLLVGLLLTLPNTELWALGAELITTAVVAGSVLFILDRRANRDRSVQTVSRILDRANPNIISTVLVGVGGVGLILNLEWALFLAALGVVLALVGGVIGAWLLLVRVTD